MENKSRDNKQFFKFYHDIIGSSTWAKLSLAAKAVYPVIAKYTNHKTGESFPSLSTISKNAGLHRESVVNAITDLINAGLIIKRKGGGRISNVYQLVYFYEVVGLSDSSSHIIRPHKSNKQTAPVRLSNTNYININDSNITISKDKIITNISIEREIVDNFYNNLGLNASRIKKERGYKIAKNLLNEGFNKNELRYSVDWALTNLKDKINSFSLIPHVIDQALKDKKRIDNKNILGMQQEKELLEGRKRSKERARIYNHINSVRDKLSEKELVSFRNRAATVLEKDHNVKKGPVFDAWVRRTTDNLILKKYPVE